MADELDKPQEANDKVVEIIKHHSDNIKAIVEDHNKKRAGKQSIRRATAPVAKQWDDVTDMLKALEERFPADSIERVNAVVNGGPTYSRAAGSLDEALCGDQDLNITCKWHIATEEDYTEARRIAIEVESMRARGDAEFGHTFCDPDTNEERPYTQEDAQAHIDYIKSLPPEVFLHDLQTTEETEAFFKYKAWYEDAISKLTPAEKGLLQVYELASVTGETLYNIADWKINDKLSYVQQDSELVRTTPEKEVTFDVLTKEDVPDWILDNIIIIPLKGFL